MSDAAGTQTREVARGELTDAATGLLASGHRLALMACHQDDDHFRIVYAFTAPAPETTVELVLRVTHADAWIPSLAGISYPAGRFEREIRDLYGVRPEGHPLPQRLLRHAHWPTGWYPMLRDADPNPRFDPDVGSFPFLEVQGHGVYEIPVGPVHAGLIEPGHFRFSVVGETILRMKARLWFLHRGLEKLFEGRSPTDGLALAERISGDTAVGHTLAYAMAVEEALGIHLPGPQRRLRALLLELERLHNHVADLGALANDVGFGIANAHAGRLREALLRINRDTTGHRLLRGAITIGGAAVRSLPDPDQLRAIATEVEELVDLTLGHSVVADRFTGTAVLTSSHALEVGTLGYVARASGLTADARSEHPFTDLGPSFTVVAEPGGDVLARYRVRAREFAVSVAVILDLLGDLDVRDHTAPTGPAQGPGAGLSQVEAWRGTLVHRVELDANGTLSRVKVVDPSFFNWPALPIALADTIVPDFPLANKSFNQSYAGNDL
jgi:Ni,Fe-hydrogenase III large subunit/Ni,Fe-hydrogenase III component G